MESLNRIINYLIYLIEAFEIETTYICFTELLFYNELISTCFMNVDRQHWIFLTCKSVRTGKFSVLAQNLSKPQNPRQFHLLVAKKNKSIKLKRERIILQVKLNQVNNSDYVLTNLLIK